MTQFLLYAGFFLGGVVLDEVFGARIVSKLKAELSASETRITAAFTAIVADAKSKL
jgi:hypothetical protein